MFTHINPRLPPRHLWDQQHGAQLLLLASMVHIGCQQIYTSMCLKARPRCAAKDAACSYMPSLWYVAGRPWATGATARPARTRCMTLFSLAWLRKNKHHARLCGHLCLVHQLVDASIALEAQ